MAEVGGRRRLRLRTAPLSLLMVMSMVWACAYHQRPLRFRVRLFASVVDLRATRNLGRIRSEEGGPRNATISSRQFLAPSRRRASRPPIWTTPRAA